jgi:lysophospholipase L1-like esterase
MMAKKISIACKGTSLTRGVNQYDEWQTRVANGLRVGNALDVVCYNFGILGGSTVDGLADMATCLLVRPEIAIIEYSVNDAYSPYAISVAQSKTNHLNLIAQFRAVNPSIKIFLMTMNRPVPGDANDTLRPNLSSYLAMVRQMVVDDLSLGLIDNEPLWGTSNYLRIPDGIHPTRAAEQQVFVQNIITALDPFIT